MSTHTPGPWNCAPTGTQMRDGYTQPFGIMHFGEGSQVTLIAGCFGDLRGGDKVASANARLIAAAPELLEALLLARESITALYNSACPHGKHEAGNRFADLDPSMGVINDAIAKATGAS